MSKPSILITEGNVLFIDALNTFYLRLSDVGDMIKETRYRHYMTYYVRLAANMIAHTTAFLTPVVEHWLERVIAQCVHHVEVFILLYERWNLIGQSFM